MARKCLGTIAISTLISMFVLSLPCFSQDRSDESDQKPLTPAEKKLERLKEKSNLKFNACGPKGTKFHQITDKDQHPTPDAPEGKAMVYVLRPTRIGFAIQTKLAVDGEWVGVNKGKTYFYFPLDPGKHQLCSKSENRSLLEITVEAGKTYYLQQKIKAGWLKARNKLIMLDPEKGSKKLGQCHLSLFTLKP